MTLSGNHEAQLIWAQLGARAAMQGVSGTEEILSWLAQQPEFAPAAAAPQRPSKEDSSPTELSAAARAKKLADDILHAPTTTDQAIELAKVYALLAIHERMPEIRKPATRTTKKDTS